MWRLEFANLRNNLLTLDNFETSSPFYGNKEIVKLDLSRNNISRIFPDWRKAQHLQELDLSFNKIQKIDVSWEKVAVQFPQKVLWIFWFQVRDLEFESEKVILNLEDNLIEKFDLDDDLSSPVEELITRRVELRIRSNPIICDCSLVKFVHSLTNGELLLSENAVYVPLENVMCFGPESLRILELNLENCTDKSDVFGDYDDADTFTPKMNVSFVDNEVS